MEANAQSNIGIECGPEMSVSEKKSAQQIAELINGFLYGLAEVSGEIRQYYGGAFTIEGSPDAKDASGSINYYFHPQHQFSFQFSQSLPYGSGDLEKLVSDHLFHPEASELDGDSSRGKYLAFRLMDMLDEFFDGLLSRTTVTLLRSSTDDSNEASVFFHICLGKKCIVLQFNRNF